MGSGSTYAMGCCDVKYENNVKAKNWLTDIT